MAKLGFRSGKDELAIENLLSQANDLYVLEQVAARNLCGFTHSSLPTHLETRFRRLKSLPDPVSSSSSNKKRNQRNTSSAFSGDEKRALKNLPRNIGSQKIGSSSCRFSDAKTYPLDNEAHIVSGNKRNLSVNSRGGALSDSRKIGSSSCRFSRERKIFNPTAHNFPKEISRFSSSSFTSIDLASPTSDPNLKEEGSNRKPKSKLSISWFKKLAISPAQAIGCLLWRPPTKSSSNTKKTVETSSNKPLPRRHKETDFGEFSVEEQRKMLKNAKSYVEEQRKMLKNAITESQRMRREAAEIIKTRK